ncbi:hypothetical protein [Dictyobacter kobayashii]|uniref:Uncharacterized protein n=1 Tax=Dictyobacter kobayashii TaxID=2014872 RepID=A0A402AFP6_9CHLR|nr:hypothetical protein [Dictyobacter kobayashii]GCE17905.1 hypothetical protein KDK_17050 [Dictyobacter kobayashii]
MSMSEFEENSPESQPEIFCLPNMEGIFPDDFSMDEIEFACELDALFSPEQEELPPLFVQTLMESEDKRFQSVEHGFELKTRAAVFRRLQLERHIVRSPHPSLRSTLFDGFTTVSHPLLAFCASCVLFMLLTVVATAPAFASGLNYLLTGAHSGVLLVNEPPPIASSSQITKAKHDQGSAKVETQQISLIQAQQRLHFPLSIPLAVPARYNQSDFYIYEGDKTWADGPIMVVEYTYSLPGVAPKHITICEFKPQSNVYLVVKDGAAKQIPVTHGGNSDSAIFVEGHWTQTGDSNATWVYNDRSEIVDEQNGVVFWIVGDPSDGINNAELTSVANSMQIFDLHAGHHIGGRIDRVTQSDEDTPQLFANDVISLDNPDNNDGPSFRLVGATSDQPQSRNGLNSQFSFID